MSAPQNDVVIIGTGYVGLTTAACLASIGRSVTAIDIDETKIAALKKGHVPILEEGLDALVEAGLNNGQLRFDTRYAAAATAPVVMLCLPTPSQPNGGLELSYIQGAAQMLGPLLAPDATVITKSTVPVGTHRQLARWLNRPDVHVVANPEFLREGTAVADFLRPDRIVIGAHNQPIADRVAALYKGVDAPVQRTDPTSAELIKYAANTFLATKLSFVNEMSRLCDHLGGDIDAVTEGLGSDHRIGTAFLRPGPGWGGSCFPKDTRGLSHLAQCLDRSLPVTEAAATSNQLHLAHITSSINRHCQTPLDQARIAIWGATFKADTDDTRDSPALEIIKRLDAAGATVTVYDPAAHPDAIATATAEDPYSACVDADLLVVLTEWTEFSTTDLDKVYHLMRQPVIYDTRAVITAAAASAAGITLHRPGRATVTP